MGLQLSLTAIVSFILAIMIFSFGLMILFTIIPDDPIPVPDFCRARIERSLEQGEQFVVCPTTLDVSQRELERGVSIQYGIANIRSAGHTYTIILDSPPTFDIAAIGEPIRARESRIGILQIGSDALALSDMEFVKFQLQISPYAGGGPPETCGILGSPDCLTRTITVNIR